VIGAALVVTGILFVVFPPAAWAIVLGAIFVGSFRG
jgi:hypothetical protein